MINPDYLRTFIALAENGHFTRTAEKLNMTQPGVSQHLRKLEDHFKTKLIKQSGKSFVLTESGKKLLAYAKTLFRDFEEMKAKIGEDDPFAGRCRYASPGSFGLNLFDALLRSAKLHPNLDVELTVAPNHSIGKLLLDREIDVGFMTSRPDDTRLQSDKYAEEKLLLLVPRGKRIQSFSDLAKLNFVNHPDGFQLAERLLRLNFEKEFSSMTVFRCRVFINQISRIIDPVADGLGFTVLPESVFQNFGRRNLVSAIKTKIAVVDTLYRVTRQMEPLPLRYQTVDKILRQ